MKYVFQLLIFDWEGTLVDKTQLIAGAKSVLVRLHAEGYLLAIATAKSKHGLVLDLEKNGISHLFHATCTAQESADKPDPAMLFNILDQLAIKPQDALMIGDTPYDIEMAHRAKMSALAVGYGLYSCAELTKAQPKACINDITELPQWLKGDKHGT
jgi:phosphoglycolate phosphatase